MLPKLFIFILSFDLHAPVSIHAHILQVRDSNYQGPGLPSSEVEAARPVSAILTPEQHSPCSALVLRFYAISSHGWGFTVRHRVGQRENKKTLAYSITQRKVHFTEVGGHMLYL